VTVVIVNTIMKAPTKWFVHSFQHTSVIVNCCGKHLPPIGIEYTESFMYPHKKSHGNFLGSRGTPERFATHYTISMYSLFENKRAIFTKLLLKSQNQHVNTCPLRSDKTNWKCNPLVSTSAAQRKNFILKTDCFAPILQKLLFHGHCHWVE
jgi:hypothetical protein